jgi:hypothetical protein
MGGEGAKNTICICSNNNFIDFKTLLLFPPPFTIHTEDEEAVRETCCGRKISIRLHEEEGREERRK